MSYMYQPQEDKKFTKADGFLATVLVAIIVVFLAIGLSSCSNKQAVYYKVPTSYSCVDCKFIVVSSLGNNLYLAKRSSHTYKQAPEKNVYEGEEVVLKGVLEEGVAYEIKKPMSLGTYIIGDTPAYTIINADSVTVVYKK